MLCYFRVQIDYKTKNEKTTTQVIQLFNQKPWSRIFNMPLNVV